MSEKKLLAKLTKLGFKYALIRLSHKKDHGDLDIIVENFEKIENYLFNNGFVSFKKKKNNRKFLKYDFESNQWIHLDVYNYFQFGKIKINKPLIKKMIKNSKLSGDGIRVLNKYDIFIINLFHYAINKKKFKINFLNFANKLNKKSFKNKIQYDFLVEPIETYIDLIKKLKNNTIEEKIVIQKILKDYKVTKNHKLFYFKKIIRRLVSLSNGNQAVVFLGPDGSGKSTITKKISSLKWPSIKYQYMGPANLNSMSYFFFKLIPTALSLRNKYKIFNPIGFLVRVIYTLLCYFDLIERLYKHMWFWGSNGVVLFDRYAFDIFIRKNSWIYNLFFIYFFPKPKFIFLCIGNPQKIRKRKPELTINQIKLSIKQYKQILKKYNIKHKVLNTTENTLQQNIEIVIKKLIARNK